MRIDFCRVVRGVFIGLVLGLGAGALRAVVPAPTAIPEGGHMLFTQAMLAFSARPEERAQATKVRADGALGEGEVWRVEIRVGDGVATQRIPLHEPPMPTCSSGLDSCLRGTGKSAPAGTSKPTT